MQIFRPALSVEATTGAAAPARWTACGLTAVGRTDPIIAPPAGWKARSLTACVLLAAILWSAAPLADDALERAFSLVAEKRYSEARAILDPLLERAPDAPRVRLVHGVLLAREGKTAEAIALFESLRKDRPEMFEAYNNLAVLYAGEGRLEAARRTSIAALERRPEAVAYANLGDIYMRLARRAYARARGVGDEGRASAERGGGADTVSPRTEAPAGFPGIAGDSAKPQVPVARPPMPEHAAAPGRAPGACLRAQGFKDNAAADEAAKWMRSLGAEDVELRREQRRVVNGYRVYLPVSSGSGAAAEKLRELRRRGVRDSAIVGKGDRVTAISLGVYRKKVNVRRRATQLEKLGYSVETAAKTAIAHEYAIRARVGGARSAIDDAWRSKYAAYPIRYVDCAAGDRGSGQQRR